MRALRQAVAGRTGDVVSFSPETPARQGLQKKRKDWQMGTKRTAGLMGVQRDFYAMMTVVCRKERKRRKVHAAHETCGRPDMMWLKNCSSLFDL